jgi:hypothetical protein
LAIFVVLTANSKSLRLAKGFNPGQVFYVHQALSGSPGLAKLQQALPDISRPHEASENPAKLQMISPGLNEFLHNTSKHEYSQQIIWRDKIFSRYLKYSRCYCGRLENGP